VQRLKSRGIRVGSLVGSTAHARAQLEAGVDLLVAQGSEAGGIREPSPPWCLAADRRSRRECSGACRGWHRPWAADGRCARSRSGRRLVRLDMARTTESELDPELRQRFYEARAEDAVRTRSLTGKPCRALRSRYTEAWEQPGAPATLPMPLQTLLWLERDCGHKGRMHATG